VRIERSHNFGRSELNQIVRLVEQHRVELLESWNGFFS
jgi:hypothetical protein